PPAIIFTSPAVQLPTASPHPYPTRRSSDLGCPSLLISLTNRGAAICSCSLKGKRGRDCPFSSQPYSLLPAASRTTFCPLPYQSRSEEHTSELQSRFDIVCRLLLEKKNSGTV